MSRVVSVAQDDEYDQNAVWALREELLNAHQRYTGLLSDDPSDAVLVDIAHDLGEFVLDLANDPRLESAIGAVASGVDLRQSLYQLLLVDWPAVLASQGVDDPDLARDIRASLLESVKAPQSSTYTRLRGYLTDLGNRLVEQEQVEQLGQRRRRRLARRVGRALWVIGRIGLAATAGVAVAAALPAIMPALGIALGGTVALAGTEVAKEIVKALAEQVIPKPSEGGLDAREDVELNIRLSNFSSLIALGRIGRLHTMWDPDTVEYLPADTRASLTAETRAWISAVQASVLVLRPMCLSSWGPGGDSTLGNLALALGALDQAVAQPPGSGTDVAVMISRLDDAVTEASRLAEQQRFRPHP